MAAETLDGFPGCKFAPECFGQVFGDNMSISGRGSQPLIHMEVADQALIHFSIFFKDPCLRVLAKDPANRHGYGVCSARHGVGAAAIFCLHRVEILALLNTKIWMRLQRRVCSG